MDKYQKALNNIAIPLATTDFIAEHVQDFKRLKELVDKMTPVKPLKGRTYMCCKCYNHLSKRQKYCHCCGQRQDWDE